MIEEKEPEIATYYHPITIFTLIYGQNHNRIMHLFELGIEFNPESNKN